MEQKIRQQETERLKSWKVSEEKYRSVEERKSLLRNLCELFEVEGIDKAQILEALANERFSDFEDCLQMECTIAFRADYIVTRNCDDFKGSRIPCIEPEEFCKLI
ncbi:MAG TPA: PIN domain-containing protein [Candidatus Acetatifactor stercoripullorum]|uniref:PIN domain-containing protein n=1 Tax=Candidatus Acetatifactor stercoripullorum TaxID=2838414 RepID=A0A9D1R690_9FIRM|nr:PIN domain-containing protein [uncultured Acetatifactor sp.]HIW81797.1 PIN domain-containing protein [Candidatus Acetatifactor stercoripullorum]